MTTPEEQAAYRAGLLNRIADAKQPPNSPTFITTPEFYEQARTEINKALIRELLFGDPNLTDEELGEDLAALSDKLAIEFDFCSKWGIKILCGAEE